ncbi:TPA_asm: UL6.6 [Human alphaherpesvirus 1]|nr:TPA_asm: UL6.6 [Human alphaherpesvirus 1]
MLVAVNRGWRSPTWRTSQARRSSVCWLIASAASTRLRSPAMACLRMVAADPSSSAVAAAIPVPDAPALVRRASRSSSGRPRSGPAPRGRAGPEIGADRGGGRGQRCVLDVRDEQGRDVCQVRLQAGFLKHRIP